MNIPLNHLDPDHPERHPAYDPDRDADTQAIRELERVDPELTSLLDAALATPPAPQGLSDRVYAATVDQLETRDASPVLGRIGGRTRTLLRYAVAAVLMIGWTGLWMTGGGIVRDAYRAVTLNRDIAVFQRAQPVTLAMDDEIDALAIELATLDRGSVYDASAEQWVEDLSVFGPALEPIEPTRDPLGSNPTM